MRKPSWTLLPGTLLHSRTPRTDPPRLARSPPARRLSSIHMRRRAVRSSLPNLSQRGKQRLLPSCRINRPAHFGFVLVLQRGSPDRLIALISSHVKPVHHRHSTRQLAVCFDIHIMRAPLRPHARVKGNAHGHRVRQRDAVFSSLNLVSFPRLAVALDGEAGHFGIESLKAFDIAFLHHRFSSGELPADQFDGKPAAEDDARRLGVYPDV